jgi:hypothetical protein
MPRTRRGWQDRRPVSRAPRHRRYVTRRTLALLRPLYRHSPDRDAYVLRGIGGRFGPVLSVDRRFTRSDPPGGVERRGSDRAL